MKNRALSFVIIIAIYAAAVAAGAAVLVLLPPVSGIPRLFLDLLFADVAATIVVFIFSLIFKNASVYDPYWSVMPIFIVVGVYWYYGLTFSAHHLFVLLPLLFWAIRLTYNWARGFENMKWEDWRYRKYRAEHPKLFPVISFFGIMLMPTVLVYLGMLPAWFVFMTEELSFLHIAGGAIILFAVAYQAIADEQMRKFRRENKGTGKCIDCGLWRRSRHPNYFGEILIWWGMAVAGCGMMIGYTAPAGFALTDYQVLPWILCLLGALMITGLFNFISIPMMEKHILSTRPQYEEYTKRVPNALIPWFRKNAVIEPQIQEEI